MSGHSGSATGAALVLVLFILLVIILIAASGHSRYDSLNPLPK
ncbi:YjcZ family sporulation protein [Chengkuizengella sp. SCS-71B]